MPKKIFQTYDTLLNADGLMSEFEGFSEGGYSQTIHENGKEVKIYLYLDDFGQAMGIDGYMNMRANVYAQSLFNDTEKRLEELTKDEIVAFSTKYSFYYLNLISEFEAKSSNKHLKTFYIQFLQIAIKIDQLFAIYYKIHELKYDSIIKPNSSESGNSQVVKQAPVSKIKWLGRANVLATLFYDLLHGQDRGPSLIEATQEDVKNFLMNNFLDADGNDLTLDTVITYIRPDKVEKRAKRGDRIELGNVKLKNKKEL